MPQSTLEVVLSPDISKVEKALGQLGYSPGEWISAAQRVAANLTCPFDAAEVAAAFQAAANAKIMKSRITERSSRA